MLSNELFWYVIEAEIALLAVCLPALNGFRRTRPIESIIRSVQSKLSLRSGSSAAGRDQNHVDVADFPDALRYSKESEQGKTVVGKQDSDRSGIREPQ